MFEFVHTVLKCVIHSVPNRSLMSTPLYSVNRPRSLNYIADQAESVKKMREKRKTKSSRMVTGC